MLYNSLKVRAICQFGFLHIKNLLQCLPKFSVALRIMYPFTICFQSVIELLLHTVMYYILTISAIFVLQTKNVCMKKHILSSLLFSASLCSAFMGAAQSPTAPALGFNVFLEGSARLVTNETEGPVAMGGNLKVDGGYQVSIHSIGTFQVGGIGVSLVVGGRVEYLSGNLQVLNNGYVKIGDCIGSTVWYQDPNGAYPPIRITPGSSYDASPRINLSASANTLGVSASVKPVCQANVIDFASAFAAMRSSCTCMNAMADNAVLTNSAGTPIPHTGLPNQVKINLHSGLNVLNITGADFNAMDELTFTTPPSASKYLVVNVNASGTYNWDVPNINGVGFSNCPYVLYNFRDVTTLNIVGYGSIQGTVFAPNADIVKTVNMANLEGQVIAKSYHHAGGETHYAVFTPTVSTCGGTIATDASFTVNSNNQCLDCNSFVFNNTSTGSGTLSYLWTFGDGTTSTAVSPTKVYTAVGTYTVKLKTTGAGGMDSATMTVNVAGNPPYGFTVNDVAQPLTGNSFTFTSTTPTFGNLYYWTFGNGGTSTAANPVHTYTATGVYNVMQRVTGPGGCVIEAHMTVVVESDGVGGGGGGGLESESLGDLISKREYAKIKNSVPLKENYNNRAQFHKPTGLSAAAKGTAATSSLQRFMPANLDATTTPKITSPEELKNITRAVDAFSVDYVKNDVARGVVLGITTEDKPYNHTKSICDRFRGAELISTKTVTLNGFNFIEFALRQADGHVEHSITFAVGKSANSTSFRLQGKWLISKYEGDDSVFNFQVWATNPESLHKLTTDMLNNLAAVMPIQQIDANFDLPQTYMTKGSRKKEFLDVTFMAARATNNAKFIFIQKLNETANEDTLIIPFNLQAGTDNHFSIPVYDGYEYEGHLYVNDTLADDVYIADGGWSLDIDKSLTTILNFKPNNNKNRIYADDEFPLYRSVHVAATTTDYISIYKFIKAGQEEANLSAFNSYKFFARGNGNMTIRLIKKSVVKFADQYQTTVALDPNGKNYQIAFEDFTSANLGKAFDPSDVTAVVYTFEYKGVSSELNFYADEQAFSPTKVQSVKALLSKKVDIIPNPATDGNFQVKFVSETDRNMDITVTDITGRVVYTQSVKATMGANAVQVQIPGARQGVYFVQLGNDDLKYGVNKVSILK